MTFNRLFIGLLGVLALVAILVAFSGPSDELKRATITGSSIKEGAIIDETSQTSLFVNKDLSSFNFEGFGPGKSHKGTFDEWEIDVKKDGEKISEVTFLIQADSVNTGIGKLDNHLQSEDFFEVEKFPQIAFKSTSISDETVTGDLTLHGITKKVSFPIEFSDKKVSADFALDSTPFKLKYLGVSKEVRIFFDIFWN